MIKIYNEIYGDIEFVVIGLNKGYLIEFKVMGGGIDFWLFEFGLFGCGCEYDLLFFDEIVFIKDGMLEIYRDVILFVVVMCFGFCMFLFLIFFVMDLLNFFYVFYEYKDYKWNLKIGVDNYEWFKVYYWLLWCNFFVDDKWLCGEYRKCFVFLWC